MNTYEYLLGVFLGDGTARDDGMVSFAVANDNVPYQNRLVELLLSEFPNCGVRVHQDPTVSRVRFFRKSLVDLFKNHKTNYKWNLPEIESPASLLAGIVDSDGHISVLENRSPAMVVSQKIPENIVLVSQLFSDIGIQGRTYLDMPYTNSLGSFFLSQFNIKRKDDLLLALELPFQNPERIGKASLVVNKLHSITGHRKMGELENMIISVLPNTGSKILELTGLTSGNLYYKLGQMEKSGLIMKSNQYPTVFSLGGDHG